MYCYLQAKVNAAMLYDTVFLFLQIAEKVFKETQDPDKVTNGEKMYNNAKSFSIVSGKFLRCWIDT